MLTWGPLTWSSRWRARAAWRGAFSEDDAGAPTSPYLFLPALYVFAAPLLIEHNATGYAALGWALLAGLGFGGIAVGEVLSVRTGSRLFPPAVTGTVILSIGLSLMRVGINWAGGGLPTLGRMVDGQMGQFPNPAYGALDGLAIALFVLLVMLAGFRVTAWLATLVASLITALMAVVVWNAPVPLVSRAYLYGGLQGIWAVSSYFDPIVSAQRLDERRLGGAVAAYDGAFSWGWWLLALIAGCAVHLGLNIANDLSDDVTGADAANVTPTPFSVTGSAPTATLLMSSVAPAVTPATAAAAPIVDEAKTAQIEERLERMTALRPAFAAAWEVDQFDWPKSCDELLDKAGQEFQLAAARFKAATAALVKALACPAV